MPSKKVITPILAGKFYHLYNRGINRQEVFFTAANYHFFLQLIHQHLTDYCNVLTYALLPNHFHLIIEIKGSLMQKDKVMDDEEPGNLFINQFRRLLISYTMAINKQEKRSGSLFDSRYKRLLIESEEYLKYLVFYCHFNPEKHGLTRDFTNYSFSSYNAYVSGKPTQIYRDFMIEIFGGLDNLIAFHQIMHEERSLLILED